MKKLLALVLALVMAMSLVTISNADFKDADEIDYTEAVEVLNAVGVLEGSDGKFSPKAELNRAQACKIIAYLDLGKDVAEALPALQVYSDVPADNWAAKFVAYCADAGYVSGVGDGKFDPNAKVTGYQFGKMLLCVLGYDAQYEQFTGDSWQIKVAKMMQSLELNDGVDKSASLALTREEAAQYAFNALTTQTVTANKGTTTEVNGVTVVTGGKAADKNENTIYYDGDSSDKAAYLCEQLYGKDLKWTKEATGDKLGRPAHTWTYDGEDVGTYADTADYVLVFDEVYSASGFSTNAKISEELQDLTGNTKLTVSDDVAKAPTLCLNGDAMSLSAAFAAIRNSTRGLVVELFCDDKDDSNLVTHVVLVRETAAQIVDVKDNTGKATTVVEGEKVVYDYNLYVDTDLDGTYNKRYNEYTLEGYASTYVEDAYLSVILDSSGNVVDSKLANTVSGAISAWNPTATKPTSTLGGTKYNWINKDIPGKDLTIDFKTGEYELVLDANGYVTAVVKVKAADASLEDVVYTNGAVWTDSSTKYGKETMTYYLQVVDMDGVVKDVVVGGYKVDTTNTVWGIVTAATTSGTTTTATTASIAAGLYVIDTDDEGTKGSDTVDVDEFYTLSSTAPTDYAFGTVTNSGITFKTSDTKLAGNYLLDSTKYILVKGEGSSTKTGVYTGGLNYKTTASSESIYVVTTDDTNKEVTYVVIAGSTLKTTTTDMFYVKSATTTTTADGYLQTVYDMDGNKSEIVIVKGDKDVTGFVTYTVDEDGVYDLETVADVAISASDDWDEDEVIDTGLVYAESYYADRIGLVDSSYTLADIPAADMVVVDLRGDSDKNGYDADITSIEDMTSATKTFYNDGTSYYYAVKGSVYVDEDGAVIFFVTSTVKGVSVS